jgi:hypothetical protein
VHDAPETPSLHGFSFVRSNPGLSEKTFIVAGAGELREGTLDSRGIIRCGDVSAEAICEKARYVLEIMEDRLLRLGGEWNDVTSVNVYTIHPLEGELRSLLVQKLSLCGQRGIVWHWTRPPVVDIEFEMDLRGVTTEWVV